MNAKWLFRCVASVFLLCGAVASAAEDVKEKQATESAWRGFQRLDFEVAGRKCLLVSPKVVAEGKPWIWRTEFFDHEPQADVALLEKGFHVAYIDVTNMYGAPAALALMADFHRHLEAEYGLAPKAVLEGFSRGGLFALNYAIRYPERVAALYLDAPVCDIKSWPAGWGEGPGSAGDWERCKNVYGFASDEDARQYAEGPLDKAETLVKAGIPVLSVYGDADEAVPVNENTLALKNRLEAFGGELKTIAKAGGKHHPHSLPDPTPIVDFILKATGRGQ